MDFNTVLLQLLALVPTVAATALIIERAVELAKKQGWVPEDGALLWVGAGNALAYGLLWGAAQLGYATQVNEYIAWVNAHLDALVALAGFVALVLSSSAATKGAHELTKKIGLWWASIGVKG